MYLLRVSGCNQRLLKHFENMDDAMIEMNKAKVYYESGGFSVLSQCRSYEPRMTLRKHIFNDVYAEISMDVYEDAFDTQDSKEFPWNKDAN